MLNELKNTNMTTLANQINITANKVVNSIVGAASNGLELSKELFDCVLRDHIEADGIKFENATTYHMFVGFVHTEVYNITPVLYQIMFPLVGMDENGDYTYDSAKWA